MLKRILSLASFIVLSKLAFSQINEGGTPLSFQKVISGQSAKLIESAIAEYKLTPPDLSAVTNQDLENDEKGNAYRVGINMPVNLTMQNAGTWSKLADGTNVWRLVIESKNAVALGLYFQEEVKLPIGSKLFAYNANHRQIAGAYTSNTPSFEAMEMIQGEKLFLEYSAPGNVLDLPVFSIKEVVYFYRGVQDHTDQFKDAKEQTTKAESCQVDVACSEGTNWQNQIKAVVHYSFSDSQGTYVCSGATINNTSQNCTPYLLTAWHCGERTAGSSISSWVFYWRYQKTTCSTGAANASDPNPGSYTMTGGTVKASSGNGTMTPTSSQVAGSDFYLVQLSSSIPSTYQPFLAGWDRTNTAATSGVGIHHPAGSAKKISTYTSSLASSTYNGGSANAHWRVIWAATTNGHGVTEGGSSGSPIFNQNGRIVGQLSGGSSYCNTPTQPDLYGKIYYDWDQNGSTSTAQLKAWLDPTNTGATTLDGIAPPCSSTPAAPVAAFFSKLNFSSNRNYCYFYGSIYEFPNFMVLVGVT